MTTKVRLLANYDFPVIKHISSRASYCNCVYTHTRDSFTVSKAVVLVRKEHNKQHVSRPQFCAADVLKTTVLLHPITACSPRPLN